MNTKPAVSFKSIWNRIDCQKFFFHFSPTAFPFIFIDNSQSVYCNSDFITLFSERLHFDILNLSWYYKKKDFEFESIFWKLLLMANINVCLIFPYICFVQWELHSSHMLPPDLLPSLLILRNKDFAYVSHNYQTKFLVQCTLGILNWFKLISSKGHVLLNHDNDIWCTTDR